MPQEEREKEEPEERRFEVMRPLASGDGCVVRMKVGDQWRPGVVIFMPEGGVIEIDRTPVAPIAPAKEQK